MRKKINIQSLRGHEVPEAISIQRLRSLSRGRRLLRPFGARNDSAAVPAGGGRGISVGLLAMTVVMFAVLISLSGCGPQSAEATVEKPAVVINKLKLTSEEIMEERQVTAWTHDTEMMEGGEPEWIARIIERELLVQEAQRLGIDREPEFMRTIERFWKEALIKTLLDRKAREISARTNVFEPEIEAEYKKLAGERGGQPVESLAELRDEILREVRQGKEAEALDAWVTELRTQAKIEVNGEAVQAIE